MRFGTLCSGIGAPECAWVPMGWEPVFASEIEAFPSAVHAARFPGVPNLGDMTKWEEWNLDANGIDVVCAGTPCQSFSVAGLRAGLADDRGNLALEFCRFLGACKSRWIVWENVPGVLSSNGGRDFGAIIGAFSELGYGVCWRVLDAQNFGVPQRRRRVFVVGYLGDWRRAAAVLFERESLRGDTAPGREKRQEVAPTISARPTGGGGLGTDFDLDGGLIAPTMTGGAPFSRTGNGSEVDALINHVEIDPVGALSDGAHMGGGLNGQDAYTGRIMACEVTHTLRAEHDASEDGCGRGTPLVPTTAPCLTSNYGKQPDSSDTSRGPCLIAFHPTQDPISGEVCRSPGANATAAVAISLRGREGGATAEVSGPISPALRAAQGGGDKQHVLTSAVRRLTPRECERLQGFPDDYTRIPYRNKPADQCPDGPRYKAIGNSMAVPVLRWIGERIQAVDGVLADG